MSGWGLSPWGTGPWGDPTGLTDQDLLNQIEYMILENGNADADGVFLTDMFTVEEVVAAMNQRQYAFLKETGCVMTGELIPVIAGQMRYGVDPNYIDTRRLSYKSNLPGSNAYALYRTDPWAFDNGLATWEQTSGAPQAWQQVTLPTLAVQIGPKPALSGGLSHLFIALSQLLTGLGIPMTVPDEFSWAILYGTLADLLGSDGEGLDAKRAQYCEQRYQQGVELCKLLIQSAQEGAQ